MGKIGFGVIGTGLWGEMHAKLFASTDGIELKGVSDIDFSKAEKVAQSLGTKAYGDYRDLLADDSIKAVSIVTPDFAHSEIAIASAKAGKHILVEKPLATTTEECQKILEAVENSGVKLMVDFHNRWSPPFYKMREALKKGEIGDPQHIYYRLSDTIYVPTEMLSWAGKSTVAWFIGSHSIDTMRWLLDDEVKRVFAVSGNNVLKGMEIDTPDFYQVSLEFKSGVKAQLENSWILPNSTPNIIDLKCELVGSKGALYIDGSHNRAFEKYTQTDASYPDILVFPTIYNEMKGFAVESIRHFIDCVVNDRKPMVTGQDGLEVTKVINAIEESVRTGMPVDLI